MYRPHRDKRLVDLFCGSLNVAYGLQPERCLYNDANPHLMNFHRWTRERARIETVRLLNDEKHYYSMRATFNHRVSVGKVETDINAELFYYLNRAGFNGLCRFNRKGAFNVPFGFYDHPAFQTEFYEHSALLNRYNWRASAVSFNQVSLKPGDFVYADPPYDTDFTAYTAEGFSWEDQNELAMMLAAHDGPVIISNQATPRIVQLYTKLGFQLEYAKREDKFKQDRSPNERVTEVLAMKGL